MKTRPRISIRRDVEEFISFGVKFSRAVLNGVSLTPRQKRAVEASRRSFVRELRRTTLAKI